MDGGLGSDTLTLSSGTHTLTTNNNIVNIEKITLSTTSSGTNVDLSTQVEGFHITAGNFANTIKSGEGSDTIIGGSNVDTITAQGGDDIITGGAGNDIITIDSGTDTVKDLGGAAGNEDDVVVINGTAKLDAVDIIGFTATNDTKNNTSDANKAILTAANGVGRTIDVSAASGPFSLVGGTHGDTLTGGAGADIFTGNGGDDIITGGTGNDIFNISSGTDTIKDLGGANGAPESDVVVITSNGILNATVFQFQATNDSKNNATDANNAVITAKDGGGRTIDVSGVAVGSKGFKIVGGDDSDILWEQVLQIL